jgi:Nucleoside 2-deoxyribosyltransferase like
MFKEVKAPNAYQKDKTFQPVVFLAGSIEMGAAEKWQDKMVTALREFDIIALNPRRDDWDASWVQSLDNVNFLNQVSWEHKGLSSSDYIIIYFDPNTKSPITLLELGLFARGRVYEQNKTLFVCCPDGFWRKGNVEFICKEYGISLTNNLDDLIKTVTEYLSSHNMK